MGAMFISKALEMPEYNTTVRFQIWDTAGQERYRSLAVMHYRDADVALIVYDISNRKSFEGLNDWLKELNEKAPKDILTFFVANKSDMVEKEEVKLEEGRKFAEEHNGIFKMTSAKDNTGIKDLFTTIPVSLGIIGKDSIKTTNKQKDSKDNKDNKQKEKEKAEPKNPKNDRVKLTDAKSPKDKKCCG